MHGCFLCYHFDCLYYLIFGVYCHFQQYFSYTGTTGLNTKYLRKAQSYNKLTRPVKPQVSGNIQT